MIAALYVETDGCYYGLPDVDPWDIERDARKYDGPWPVVAHPPCKRWGRYWSGGPSIKVRYEKPGQDDGCFKAALEAVRKWGGVIEHPEASHAWSAFGLTKPPKAGGWVRADWPYHQGWTCCVEQGHYGHKARKASWIYACHTDLPSLKWGKAEGKMRLDEGFRSNEERWRARAHGQTNRPLLTPKERLATPKPFRDLLISIASTARLR